MPHILHKESNVPFASVITWWLHDHDAADLEQLTNDSRQYESRYLAWETVRKQTNPFFEHGTGLEGYLIGRCHDPEEALEHVLDICHEMLLSISRQFPLEYGFRSRLMKTLVGQSDDPKAIYIWATQLGATVARLRSQVYRIPEAEQFRSQTYRYIGGLPPMRYIQSEDSIRQLYRLPSASPNGHTRLLVSYNQLKPIQQDSWQVAQSIGKFGHPLVREFLRRSPN
jgi:hypothetical protein